MKMEQTECSEKLEYKIQTPGNYPEESIQQYVIYYNLCNTFFKESSLTTATTVGRNMWQATLFTPHYIYILVYAVVGFVSYKDQ
jgi:hypothetical protein